MLLLLFSSHARKRSRRKTREPYVPVVGGDDVIKSVRQARSRHDDVIYPSLLVDDCARAAGCRDCAAAAAAAGGGLREEDVEAGTVAPSDGQRRRRTTTQLPCCVTDCSCTGRASTSTQRKLSAVTPPFPSPPPPPPPPASATSRARALDARSYSYGIMTTSPRDAAPSFNNVDLMLHPPSTVVDEPLHCAPTGHIAASTSRSYVQFQHEPQ